MSIWLEISDLEVSLVPGPSDSKVLMTFHSALGVQSHRVGNEVQDLSPQVSGGIQLGRSAVLHTLNK